MTGWFKKQDWFPGCNFIINQKKRPRISSCWFPLRTVAVVVMSGISVEPRNIYQETRPCMTTFYLHESQNLAHKMEKDHDWSLWSLVISSCNPPPMDHRNGTSPFFYTIKILWISIVFPQISIDLNSPLCCSSFSQDSPWKMNGWFTFNKITQPLEKENHLPT